MDETCQCLGCSMNRPTVVTQRMREELEEAVLDGDLDTVNEILARGEGQTEW